MKLSIISVFILIIILVVGCQPVPALSEQETINIEHTLGYVIAPTWLPEGFEFSHTVMDSNDVTDYSAMINYRNLDKNLHMMYPSELPSSLGMSEWLSENLGLDWQAPEDAVFKVEIKGEEAYLQIGIWSEEVLNAIAKPDMDKLKTMTPEWDYDIFKRLFFKFKLSDGQAVDVVLLAVFDPDWITADEMLKIADSCVQVE